MYFARLSNHIEEDLERGWSSLNFGQDGFKGTVEDLEAVINECIENDEPFFISYLELWPHELERMWKNDQIRELYKNYWVVVDSDHLGLAGIRLNATTLEGAIKEAQTREDYFGEGDWFSPSAAKLVWSNEDRSLHILEL